MKKIYKKPLVEITSLISQSVIAASNNAGIQDAAPKGTSGGLARAPLRHIPALRPAFK